MIALATPWTGHPMEAVTSALGVAPSLMMSGASVIMPPVSRRFEAHDRARAAAAGFEKGIDRDTEPVLSMKPLD